MQSRMVSDATVKTAAAGIGLLLGASVLAISFALAIWLTGGHVNAGVSPERKDTESIVLAGMALFSVYLCVTYLIARGDEDER